ncbi:MAG TPA: TolC family protein [Polyangiaceae bacterium]|nr:TolC family protein [Polyangiaceae bacterium]
MLAWALLSAGPLAGAADAQLAAAEGPAAPSMGLDEARRYAREHHPAVLAARARLAAFRAEAEVPGAQWAPSVGAFAEVVGSTTNNSTTTVINNARVDLPRIGATPIVRSGGDWKPSPSTLAAVGLRQEVFDFGRIAAQTAAADAATNVEGFRGQAVRLDVDFAVAEAYYAVLAARAVLRAAASAEERSKAQRDFARAGVERGLRPPLELTRAEADVARFEVGSVRARGGLAVAQGVFAAAVGVPSPLLDATEEAPSEGALPPLATALAQATSRDPAVLEAQARVALQRAQTEAIGALLRPDLFLTGSLSGRAGGADPSSGEAARYGGWVPHIPNWNVGLVLTLPLYDANVLARRDASRAAEGARAAEVRVLEQRQSAAVRQAYTAVEVARAALAALERSVAAARVNQEQADARFRAGLGTALEVADAEALRTDAEIQLAVGAFQVGRNRALLSRTIATSSGGR